MVYDAWFCMVQSAEGSFGLFRRSSVRSVRTFLVVRPGASFVASERSYERCPLLRSERPLQILEKRTKDSNQQVSVSSRTLSSSASCMSSSPIWLPLPHRSIPSSAQVAQNSFSSKPSPQFQCWRDRLCSDAHHLLVPPNLKHVLLTFQQPSV